MEFMKSAMQPMVNTQKTRANLPARAVKDFRDRIDAAAFWYLQAAAGIGDGPYAANSPQEANADDVWRELADAWHRDPQKLLSYKSVLTSC